MDPILRDDATALQATDRSVTARRHASKRTHDSRAQLARFATVGVVATGLYLSYTHLLERYVGMQSPIAACVAFLLVVTTNYALHYSWTFRSDRPHASTIPRFISTSLGGLAINYAVVECGTRWLSVPKTWILLLGVALVVIWNYVLSRLWVFVSRA